MINKLYQVTQEQTVGFPDFGVVVVKALAWKTGGRGFNPRKGMELILSSFI
jgi:hypothetical protein